MRARLRVLTALLVTTVWLVPARAQDGFVVIVNAANPVERMSRREISRMFLKTRTRWDHGERVRSVDLPESSATRRAFSDAVHGQHSRQIEEYWQTQIFSGREIPPPKKASEDEVVDYVGRQLGGVGYVSPDTALGRFVKAIRVED